MGGKEMFKAKEVSTHSMVVYLIAGLLLSGVLYMSRPHTSTKADMLTFTAEETMVVKPIAKTAAKSIPVASTVVNEIPVPGPVQVAPFPITAPVVTYKVMPIYPDAARLSGVEGLVKLSILIGASGLPQDVKVSSSSGNAEMDDSAIKAVSQWRFSPALQGSQALSSWFEVPVSFKII